MLDDKTETEILQTIHTGLEVSIVVLKTYEIVRYES